MRYLVLCKVTKESSDGNVEGIKFTLTGTANDGTTVNMTGYTNSSGVVTFTNVPEGSGYQITEDVPEGYTCATDNPRTTSITTANQTRSFKFVNEAGPDPDPDPIIPEPDTEEPDPGRLVIVKTSDDGVVEDVSFTVYGQLRQSDRNDQQQRSGQRFPSARNLLRLGR